MFTDLAAGTVNGFPSGAPITTCNDPYPSHGFPRSLEDSPFTMTASSSSYNPEDVITSMYNTYLYVHVLVTVC